MGPPCTSHIAHILEETATSHDAAIFLTIQQDPGLGLKKYVMPPSGNSSDQPTRELEAAKSREKEASRTALYKKAAQLSMTETAVIWVMLSDATNSLQDIRPNTATGSWTAQLRHIVK